MLDPVEEAKFARLRSICRELKVPSPPEIHIRFQIRDRGGNLIDDDIQRGHSWTRNFYNAMFGLLTSCGGDGGSSFGAGYLSTKSPAGAVVALASYAVTSSAPLIANTGGFRNAGTDQTAGIILGTGDTAFGVDQYALAALIAAGNGSGQLAHTAQSAPVVAYTAGTKTWKATIARIFNNNSGGAIVIKEVGLYFSGYAYHSAAGSYLHERSVLSPTKSVPDGAQLTVTYEISMSFAAID